MLLPSERARLAACNGECACEACSKKTASTTAGSILIAVEDTTAHDGERIARGTIVKVISLLSSHVAWVVVRNKAGKWDAVSKQVDLGSFKRHRVGVTFANGLRGTMYVSGFDEYGKRVLGPAVFGQEPSPAKFADDLRTLANTIEEFATDERITTVVVGVS